MKKIFDYVLIFLLIFFIISFFNNKNDQKKLVENILFKTSKTSYSIPAGVSLKITNNTNSDIKINTCNNITLRNQNGEKIKFSNNLCKDISIVKWNKKLIDYSTDFEKLNNVWNYTFEMNINEKKYISQFEIDNRWIIWKIFVWLVYAPIYNLMAFLLSVFSYSLWWAIIVITILIRLVLLWPQHKMMLSQKKLQALQPKIKEIQKKYKGKQQELWLKMMELYKKEKVNPVWSCGFLLIQMPILLVMYRIILNIKDPSNTFYIYKSLSDFQILNIDYNFYWMDLLSTWWIVWISLAIFIWVIQFLQIKLSLNLKSKTEVNNKIVLEKKKGQDGYNSMMPDPDTMNKFMLFWMPAMVAVITYTLFAGVWLYWWMSTIFAIIQQLIVNKVIKKSS